MITFLIAAILTIFAIYVGVLLFIAISVGATLIYILFGGLFELLIVYVIARLIYNALQK